jgi:hypothetical protein
VRAFREGFCVLAVILALSVGYFAPPIQAQDPTNPNEQFQKFTAKGSTPDQAITRAFAKAGIVWDRFLNLPQVAGTDFAVLALPQVDPALPQVYQAWVVVRYRVFVEGEGK